MDTLYYKLNLNNFVRVGVDAFCDSIVAMRDEYNVDGIDLDVEDGGTNAQLQTYLIKSCRDKLGPDFLIT